MTTVDAAGFLRLAPHRLRHHTLRIGLRSVHEATRRNLEVLI
ncbi:hypothetical protein ATK17_1799 [Branchiibius hedensis]|uniref:Uncharacterized protein n=1 Tax=Branchiibius hedensis TaxID=672460 RepID=A0A2Y8ZSN1_9MICO|nr:hypothetical protein ATK17_1799 [Branchiibius hedensis]SSA34476.1 hypothetical protein SAMN04489750_1799 [Branchiibius hedensis]